MVAAPAPPFRRALERRKKVWIPAGLAAGLWLGLGAHGEVAAQENFDRLDSFYISIFAPTYAVAILLCLALEMSRPVFDVRSHDRWACRGVYASLLSTPAILALIVVYAASTAEGISIDLSEPGSARPFVLAFLIPGFITVAAAGTLILVARGTRSNIYAYWLLLSLPVLVAPLWSARVQSETIDVPGSIFAIVGRSLALSIIFLRVFRPARDTASRAVAGPPPPPYAIRDAPLATTRPMNRQR